MRTKIKPVGARALVKRDAPLTSVGKILIPESARKKVAFGRVLEVGEGEMPAGWSGKSLVGKTVIISQYAGSDVPEPINPEGLLVIVNAEEILAVVE